MSRNLAFYIFISTMLLLPRPGHAAFDTIPLGARPAGLAGAFVALADDANTALLNPAGLSLLGGPELTTFYTRLFGIEDLRRMMVAAAIPTPVGGIGFFFHSFGGELYRESVFGISYSRPLFSHLFLGATLRTLMVAIDRYGATNRFTGDAGLLLRLPSQIQLGLKIEGLRRPEIAEQSDQIPRVVRAGLSRTSDSITIAVQLDMEQGRSVTARIGQELKIAAPLVIRTGILTNPSVVFAGLGIERSHLEVAYAVSSHPSLGVTHRVSLSVRFRR